MIKCAAIGSRPQKIDQAGLDLCFETGKMLASFGVLMRSGGAEGADTAFADGYESYGGKPTIFTEEDATAAALKMASENHPAWNVCTGLSKRLLARNCQIQLGADLDDPVDFVVCWSKTPNEGGTGFGIKLAQRHKIEVINLAYKNFPWWRFKQVGRGWEYVRPKKTKRRAFLCMELCDSLENNEIKSILRWERRSLKELLEADRVVGMIDGLLHEIGAPNDPKLNAYGRLTRFLNKHPELATKRKEDGR